LRAKIDALLATVTEEEDALFWTGSVVLLVLLPPPFVDMEMRCWAVAVMYLLPPRRVLRPTMQVAAGALLFENNSFLGGSSHLRLQASQSEAYVYKRLFTR
jgi:hypothetical protein